MHAPLLPFYAGAAKGCGAAGGQPTAHCCKPEAVQGAGRPQAARRPRRRARGRSPRRRCLRHRRACGPDACPLQELSEGAPAPYTSPQKRYRRRLRPAASPKLCREPDGRRPPAAPGGGRAGGARAGGACGTAGPAARVPAPCRNFPRGRLPHTQARKKRGALRLPRKCDQILMPSSAILSRSERKSAKPFWVLAGLRSSAAGWKVPIIQTPFFSAHSPCWRVTL